MTPSPTRKFLLSEQPEVFVGTAETSRAIGRELKAGAVRKLAPRLYTRNLSDPLEAVARRNWQEIAATYFPGAVVVDRSAFEAKPSEDGSMFLDAGPSYAGRRPVRIPGLTLRPRPGPGPVGGDMPYLGGLHFSGPARKFLDNMRASRTGRGGVARTLSRAEIEDQLTRVIATRGTEALNELRDQARTAADELGAKNEFRQLDDLIGAVMGTRESPLSTDGARAQGRGQGFDPRRVDLFQTLVTRLLQDPAPRIEEQPGSFSALSFIEAYMSNWIEGTEFEIAEAEEIIFEGLIPAGRTEDAHDILGTFELVNDPAKRGRTPLDPGDFLQLLRSDHAVILGSRPAARPGQFKDRPNRAGGTTFVPPDLVNGTLIEGYRFRAALPEGFPRAAFMMFLISEVHPFTDGNGRTARVFMNAELTAAGLQRIVVPLSYRDDYLQSLRALSLGGDPQPLVRVLEFAQRYASEIDWSDLKKAEETLAATNAFLPPDQAEESGKRLRLPSA